MRKIEYRYLDKSEWERGEWDSEPDKIQWRDEVTGLPCLIVRNPMGSLCGYVGVTTGHPDFGKSYNDVNFSVHGGLTFADSCHETPDNHGICHIPGEGEPDHVWWFGFDCAHSRDISPATTAYMRQFQSMLASRGIDESCTYKNVEYVEERCRDLAKQLKEIEGGM